ncbi:Asparagine synthetase domain-containing protein [Pleurotus pulmonarius]
MCGIFFCVHHEKNLSPSTDPEVPSFEDICGALRTVNAQRGPDAQRNVSLSIPVTPSPSNDTSSPAVVHLEFFSSELRLRGTAPIVQPHESNNNILCWNGEVFEGLDINPDENDGAVLFQELCKLETPSEVATLFASIEGPYAFVFFHGASQHLFFGRDPLGRRSLLIHRPTSLQPYLLLSSATCGPSPGYEFEELSTELLFYIDFSCFVDEACLSTLPRHDIESTIPDLFAIPSSVNTVLPSDDFPELASLDVIPPHLSQAVDDLIYQLDRSTRLRVRDIPSIDSDVTNPSKVAILFSGGIDCTVLTYLAHRNIPLDEPIDLLNVAFENPRKLQSQNSEHAKRKKSGKSEQPRRPVYMVPDRISGLEELEELRRLCPGRQWNFVEIDIPYNESQAARPVIEALMFPSKTVMDLSLAMALYFASRGVGQVRRQKDSESEPYASPARVILSGLGADELLGGYSRHRTAFTHGWKSLVDELQLEIDRIPTRNLGRDDRIISSHGRETRYPFLSLSVVNFLASLPVHFKLDPRLETGLGDKMLLRLAARKLGLVEASQRKKRAMQFGSYSARMHGEKKGDVPLE